MRKLSLSKKTTAIVAAGILTVATAGGAYAFWTTTGSGTGTAATGTNTAITISGTATGAVTPGGTTSPVSFTATNPGTGAQQVVSVTLTSVDAFTGPGFTNPIPTGTGVGKCDVTQYTMTSVTENQNIAAGGPTALTNGGTLVLANDPANNQDGCKNAVLRLNLSSN